MLWPADRHGPQVLAERRQINLWEVRPCGRRTTSKIFRSFQAHARSFSSRTRSSAPKKANRAHFQDSVRTVAVLWSFHEHAQSSRGFCLAGSVPTLRSARRKCHRLELRYFFQQSTKTTSKSVFEHISLIFVHSFAPCRCAQDRHPETMVARRQQAVQETARLLSSRAG